ncbi:hypothetical protein JCM8208_000638 [Rhodotorula glutinis]
MNSAFPTGGQSTGQNVGGAPVSSTQGGNGDALDKGVQSMLNKSGHGGQSGSTVEKISDGIRTGFKKLTGKDVPIKDQQMRVRPFSSSLIHSDSR